MDISRLNDEIFETDQKLQKAIFAIDAFFNYHDPMLLTIARDYACDAKQMNEKLRLDLGRASRKPNQ